MAKPLFTKRLTKELRGKILCFCDQCLCIKFSHGGWLRLKSWTRIRQKVSPLKKPMTLKGVKRKTQRLNLVANQWKPHRWFLRIKGAPGTLYEVSAFLLSHEIIRYIISILTIHTGRGIQTRGKKREMTDSITQDAYLSFTSFGLHQRTH